MPKIPDKDWIAKYFEAGRQGLTYAQFAKEVGSTAGLVYKKRAYLRKVKGIKLAPLMHVSMGSRAHKKNSAKPSAPKRQTARPEMGAEDFVRHWQTAATFDAACEAIGVARRHVSARADRLRRKGIPLKKFEAGRRILDIPKLIALAQSLAPSDEKA